MTTGLNDDVTMRNLLQAGGTSEVAPTPFEGFFRGTGSLVMKSLATAGRSASMGFATLPVLADKITGGTTMQDRYFKEHVDTFQSAVDYWGTNARESGVAAEIAGGVLGMGALILANPAAAVVNQFASSAEDLVTAPGVSMGQALGVGAVQATGLGLGILAPPALGYNLTSKLAAGAGINLLQGVVTRGASSAVLGDNEAAKNFDALGGKDMAIDLFTGMVFGGAAHVLPSWRFQSDAATDAVLSWRARRAIDKEIGGVTNFDLAAAAAKATNNFAEMLTPTQKAAVATVRVNHHLNVETQPGRPTGMNSVNVNRDAMLEAIDSLLKDKRPSTEVRAAAPEPERPIPETPTLADLSPHALRPAGDVLPITESMVPARDWQIMSRMGLVQTGKAPDGTEMGFVEPQALAAERVRRAETGPPGEAPIGDRIADIENRIDHFETVLENTRFSEPEKARPLEDRIADLHTELETLKAERPAFEVDPVKTTQAELTTQAMREGVRETSGMDGLPETPEIVEPVHTVVERELIKAGRPAEEAKAGARLWRLFFDSVGKAKGVDPDALFHRYLKAISGPETQAEASHAQTVSRETPADRIAEYRPQVKKAAANGLPIFQNKHVALGQPMHAESKAPRGERVVFMIYDMEHGRPAKVGYVIADIDPKDNTFIALRNIRIDDEVQGMGHGEKTVATMLAQNGSKPMEIVDITHAGEEGIGSKTDALPWWKKQGTVLRNYSSNPDIQMDGVLTREAYLEARRTGEGQGQRGAALAQADRAGSEGGAGSDRGTAGARTGVASLFQDSPWYYSALGRAIDNSPTKAADAAGWKQWLKGLVNKGIVKADEIKATELEEYLDATQGKITKEQLQTFMQEGGVRVEDVELGGKDAEAQRAEVQADTDAKAKAFFDMIKVSVEVKGQKVWPDELYYSMVDGDTKAADLPPEMQGPAQTWLDAYNRLKNFEPTPANPPRFTGWQLPGAKEGSYREIALVLPETPASRKARAEMEARNAARAAGRKEVFDRYAPAIEKARAEFDALPWDAPRQVKDTLYGEMEALEIQRDTEAAALHGEMEGGVTADAAGAYKVPSAHSMGDKADINRLAHIRFNERTGPNGERVLFIEEIQSDWAQQGKKYGFAGGEPELKPGYRIWQMENGRWRIDKDDNPNRAWTTNDTREGALKSALSMGAATQSDIPNAPFVGKTDAWVALSLKRMIRYAAENGFDQVAWTTGEQQAARYNLAQVVHQIDVVGRTDARTGEQTRQVVIHAKDGSAITLGVNNAGKVDNAKPADYQGKNLEDIVGKAMAEKIMANRTQTIAGDGLKIGGEGMAGFYDKIVPTVAKDVLKKLGGGKVEATTLDIPNKLEGQYSMGAFDPASARVIQRGEVWQVWAKNPDSGVEQVRGGNFDSEQAARNFAATGGLEKAGGSEQMAFTITPEMRAKVMEGQALFQTDPFGLQAFGIKSLDEISPEYRTPEAWREVPAAMRDVDTARGVRQSVIDFERSLLEKAGWTGGLQPLRIHLHDNGNLSIDRVAGLTPEQRRDAIIAASQFATANDLGLLVTREAAGDLPTDLLTSVGLKNWYSVRKSATGTRGPVNQVMWVRDPRGAALFQRGESAGPRGFLNIEADRKMTIALLGAADASTFLHESGHFFLEVMDDLAKTTPALEADMAVLFKDWGIQRAQWDGMTLDQKRPYHEQFARGFESYLMSGEAPTPELKGLFARFRDWLLAVYKSAASLNVKVSAEVKALMDRMLDSERRDAAQQSTPQPATSGSPPPPPPEASAGKGGTIEDQDVRDLLRDMAENEAGWAQQGGRMIRSTSLDGTETITRTAWIPKADWWQGRPEKRMNEQAVYAAVAKALVGDPLKPREQATVDYMVDIAAKRLQAYNSFGDEEFTHLVNEMHLEELAPTTVNMLDVDAVAIAAQIDEAAVERLAMQHGNDDAAFMAAIRSMIDDANAKASQGSQESSSPAQAKPANQSATGKAPDLLTMEADRVAAEYPDIQMEVAMADGSTKVMTPAEYLADAREAAAMAREDIALINEAAQCLLGAL